MHKLLGVIFDEELRFRERNAYMVAKGTKWVHQLQRLSRPCVGMPPVKMGQLYKAIAIPKMLYGCDVTNVPTPREPGRKKKSGSLGFATNLARVQRPAALAITGAIRNTATDILDVHVNLLPMALNINKISQRETTRYAALPKTHPLHKVVRRANKWVKGHRSPMHELLNAFKVDPSATETVETARKPAEWEREFEVEVAGSKEEALAEEKTKHTERWKVYPNGSEIRGQVGAAGCHTRTPKK